MEPVSLSLGAFSAACDVQSIVQKYYTAYRDAPQDIEELIQRAKMWKLIMESSSLLVRNREYFSNDRISTITQRDAMIEQLQLCENQLKELLSQLPDSAAKLRSHSFNRVRAAFSKDKLLRTMAKLTELYNESSRLEQHIVHEKYLKSLRESSVESSAVQKYLRQIDRHYMRENILNWITNGACSDPHYDNLQNFQDGTLEKIFANELYYGFQNGILRESGISQTKPVLWCHGPPGAGKSILVSAIMERLRGFYSTDAVISYAFCSYMDTETSGNSILARLLRTAVAQLNSLPNYIYDSWVLHANGSNRLKLASIRDLLHHVLSSRRKSFILIDALDEISPYDQNLGGNLVTWHEVLQEVCAVVGHVNEALESNGGLSCRVLVTSRERFSCRRRAFQDQVSELAIEADDNDVRMLVNATMDSHHLPSLSEESQTDANLREQIVEQVTQSAGGVFLLPKLQLNHLRMCPTIRSLKKVLSNLPKDLFESHSRSLSRIEKLSKEGRILARQALAMVYYAREPLPVRSLQHALAVVEGDISFDKEGIIGEHALIHMTAGLLTSREGKFIFVHHSVKQFMKNVITGSDNTLGLDKIDFFDHKDVGHGFMAIQCINFLMLRDFSNAVELKRRQSRHEAFPFLEYAAQNVGYHVNNSTHDENKTFRLSEKCDRLLDLGGTPLGSLQEVASRMWHAPRLDRVINEMAPLPRLHFAVLYNFLDIARKLSTGKHESNLKATTKMETPLHFAARIRSFQMVRMLVENGASVNAVNYSGKTALDMVLEAPILALGLSQNPKPVSSPFTGMMPNNSLLPSQRFVESLTSIWDLLDTAPGHQQPSIQVQKMIRTIAQRRMALALPDEGEEIARYLIEAGIDPNSRSAMRFTPLQLATLYQKTDLVGLLLKHGADPKQIWFCSITPLEIALMGTDIMLQDMLARTDVKLQNPLPPKQSRDYPSPRPKIIKVQEVSQSADPLPLHSQLPNSFHNLDNFEYGLTTVDAFGRRAVVTHSLSSSPKFKIFRK